MDIVVCIKRTRQEPQPGQSVINPLDRNALEEGLRIREKFSGRIVALAMGSAPAKKALEEALAIGADEAVFLCDSMFSNADTLATASTLFYGIRRLGRFDLVLCGNQSTTGATGQVGPQLAELLGIPHVGCARKLDFNGEGSLLVESVLEHGYMKVRVRLPALIAVVKEINRPRLPTVWGIMEAVGKRVEVWGAKDVGALPGTTGLEGSPTRIVREVKKTFQRRREVFEGTPEEAVKKAVQKLHELGAI